MMNHIIKVFCLGAMLAVVHHSALAAPKWEKFQKRCDGTTQRVTAQLMDIPWGDSWENACADQRTGPYGIRRAPDDCVNSAGMWGVWYEEDHPSCIKALEWAGEGLNCRGGWKSTAYARLWNIPNGVSWENTCTATNASGALANKYNASGKPTRCNKGVFGEGIWGEWDNDDDPACSSTQFARYPLRVFNRSDKAVFVSAMWLHEEKLYTQDTQWIKAGDSVTFNIAGSSACNPARIEAELAGTQMAFHPNSEFDSCNDNFFSIAFWNSDGAFAGYVAENVSVFLGTWLATDFVLGKLGGGRISIPGADQAADFASKKWRMLRDPEGKLFQWGVHAWVANVPQQEVSVVYWGSSFSQDVVLDSTLNIDEIATPQQRGDIGFVYELLIDTSGNATQIERPCSQQFAPGLGFC